MRHENFLLAIASIALGFTGFFGIVSVFRNPSLEWTPREQAGLKLMFTHTFAAIAFALLPFLLDGWLQSAPITWRLCSALLGIFLACEFFTQLYRIRTVIKAGDPPKKKRRLYYHFLPGTAIFCAAQIMNSVSWQSELPFMWGLFWLLNPPAIQFYHFMLPPKDSPGPTPSISLK